MGIRNKGLAAVVAVGLLATGCSSQAGGANSAAPSGPVKLSLLTFETPNLTAKFWNDAIARTNAEVPGVTIQKLVAPTADRTAYAKQLFTSGQLPNLLVAVTPGDFVNAHALAGFDSSELTAFDSPSAGAVDGKVYQLPWASQTIPMMYYNKADFAKAGIASPPTTWAQLLDDSAKLKAAGITPIEIGGGGADNWANGMPLVAAVSLALESKPTWLQDLKTGKAKFTDPEFIAAATKIETLAKSGYLDTAGLSRSYANTEQAFRNGDAAMYPMGSWFAASADATPTKFPLGVFAWPTDDGSTVLPSYTGGCVSVGANSPNVELAKKWAIAFCTNAANMDAEVKADGVFPAIKGYTPPAGLGPAFKASLDLYTKAVAAQKSVPSFGYMTGDQALPSGMTSDLYSGIADLILGRKTPQQLADFLQSSYEKNSNG